MEGELDFTLEELESLFKEEAPESQPEDDKNGSAQAQGVSKEEITPENVETSKVFAKRLREKTEKAVAEERDKIAKDLGYENYADMQKHRESKILEDSGLNPDDVSPVVDKIIEERLKNDPRMKELDGYRQRQMQEFAKKELEEIKELTGGTITSMDQIPADVLEDWKKTGSLKKSYISLHGEELIVQARKSVPKPSTSHLQSPSGSPPAPTDVRPLTAEEKKIWKIFNPRMSDEELDKKTIKKE